LEAFLAADGQVTGGHVALLLALTILSGMKTSAGAHTAVLLALMILSGMKTSVKTDFECKEALSNFKA
jgi:hypothetical protein